MANGHQNTLRCRHCGGPVELIRDQHPEDRTEQFSLRHRPWRCVQAGGRVTQSPHLGYAFRLDDFYLRAADVGRVINEFVSRGMSDLEVKCADLTEVLNDPFPLIGTSTGTGPLLGFDEAETIVTTTGTGAFHKITNPNLGILRDEVPEKKPVPARTFGSAPRKILL